MSQSFLKCVGDCVCENRKKIFSEHLGRWIFTQPCIGDKFSMDFTLLYLLITLLYNLSSDWHV